MIMTMPCKRIELFATAILLMSMSAARATEAHYVCGGGDQLTAQFSPPGAAHGHATLTFAGSGHRIVLPQAMSADGGRYAKEGIEFWIKGRSATFTRNGKSETCNTK